MISKPINEMGGETYRPAFTEPPGTVRDVSSSVYQGADSPIGLSRHTCEGSEVDDAMDVVWLAL
jgi:hypothetical protein